MRAMIVKSNGNNIHNVVGCCEDKMREEKLYMIFLSIGRNADIL